MLESILETVSTRSVIVFRAGGSLVFKAIAQALWQITILLPPGLFSGALLCQLLNNNSMVLAAQRAGGAQACEGRRAVSSSPRALSRDRNILHNILFRDISVNTHQVLTAPFDGSARPADLGGRCGHCGVQPLRYAALMMQSLKT